jgi:hypothetical protein
MILIIDGPPASGKSTIAVFLARRLGSKVYNFKRLGFLNLFAELLLQITPSVSILGGKRVHESSKLIQVLKHERRDPLLFISSRFLQRIAFINFLLEVIYKYVRFLSLTVSALMYRNIVVDEWFSLGWANYYNLIVYKKAFKPKHIEVLIRLDIQFLRFLSKISEAHVYFIDREQEKLILFWRRRGHITSYDIRYMILVKYFFNLFVYVCEGHKIDINAKYFHLS